MAHLIVTTDSKHFDPLAPNLLDSNFKVCSPDRVWLADITYLQDGRKWYYLTISLDLFSRIVVGWDLSTFLERHSAIRVLNKSILRRRPSHGLSIRSDRGVAMPLLVSEVYCTTRIRSKHEPERELMG